MTTKITERWVSFTIEGRSGADLEAVFDQWYGELTLYNNGLVAIKDSMYDQRHYAATGSYVGAPLDEVATRVSLWGRIVRQEGVDRSVLPPVLAPLPAEAPAPPAPAVVPAPVAVRWKSDIPASTGESKVRYYESRSVVGMTSYRVGGSAGRWFVVRVTNGAGRPRRTPFVGSRQRAVELLDSIVEGG